MNKKLLFGIVVLLLFVGLSRFTYSKKHLDKVEELINKVLRRENGKL